MCELRFASFPKGKGKEEKKGKGPSLGKCMEGVKIFGGNQTRKQDSKLIIIRGPLVRSGLLFARFDKFETFATVSATMRQGTRVRTLDW